MNFLNKRFAPFTDEFRSGNQYGVYDNERKCKLGTYSTYEIAVDKANKYNINLEKIPVGLKFYDPKYGFSFYDQHLPATGSCGV